MNDSYFIDRSSDGGVSWDTVAIVPRADTDTTLEWTDGGLLPGADYVYRVRAEGSEQSLPSAYVSESTDGIAPPQMADKIRARVVAGHSPVDLRWSNVFNSELLGPFFFGDTFTHDPDCRIEYTVTTAPTASCRVIFRLLDDNNFWECSVDSAGALRLYVYIDGSGTLKNSDTSAGVGAGDVVMITAVDETILLYVNGVVRVTYSTAIEHKYAASGRRGAPTLAPSTESGTLEDLVAYSYHNYELWQETSHSSEDWTNDVAKCQISTNKHGNEACVTEVELPLEVAAQWYNRKGGWQKIITTDGRVAWEGQMRDFVLRESTLQTVAYGPWIAFGGYQFTGLFSSTLYEDFLAVSDAAKGDAPGDTLMRQESYIKNKTDQLLFSPKPEYYIDSGGYAAYTYVTPSTTSSIRLVRVTFNYELLTYTANVGEYCRFAGGVATRDDDGEWGFNESLFSIAGDGGSKAGAMSLALSDLTNFIFSLAAPSTGATYFQQSPEEEYLRITNVRVFGGRYSGPVYVYTHGIVKELIDDYHERHKWQIIRREYGGIFDTSVDMANAVWEDAAPAAIMAELATQENYDVAVWNNRVLLYAPEETYSMDWVGEVDDPIFETSFSSVIPRVSATFAGVDGWKVRTPVQEERGTMYAYTAENAITLPAPSIDYDDAVSWAQDAAELYSREQFKSSNSRVVIRRSDGGLSSPFSVRANDYVSLSPTFGFHVVGNKARFKIGRTKVDLMSGNLIVEPIIQAPSADSVRS